VLIKLACYSMLGELLAMYGGRSSVGILGAARYVVGDRLRRDDRVLDRERAATDWRAFLDDAEELEPSPQAVELATELEETASGVGLSLDVGESLLCAVTVERLVPHLLTGDKRAIEAMEVLIRSTEKLKPLAGRVVCLEQLVGALTAALGEAKVRAAVCSEPRADRTISVCFQCTRATGGRLDPDGLPSYIGELRKRAPTVLAQSAIVGANEGAPRRA
jgi:hypothetical protein